MNTVTDYKLNKTYHTGEAQITGTDKTFSCVILRFVKIRTARYEYTIRAECKLASGKVVYIKTDNIIQ